MMQRSMGALLAILAIGAMALPSLAGEATANEEGLRIAEGEHFSLDMHFFAELAFNRSRDQLDYSGSFYGWLGNNEEEIAFPYSTGDAFSSAASTSWPQEQGFNLQRARVILTGKAVADWLTFRIESETRGGGTDMELLDAWVRIEPSEQWALTFGQFKTPFGLFQLQRSWRQLLPTLSPATRYISPERDPGLQVEWRRGRFHAQAAIQNGSGRNTLDTDTDQQLTLRFELTGPNGFDYDAPLYGRPEEEQVTVGAAFVKNSLGIIDAQTRGICLPASGSTCTGSGSRDGLELFFGYRAEALTLLTSWQKWTYENNRLINVGPEADHVTGIPIPASAVQLRQDDQDLEVWQIEMGMFVARDWQVVGRWIESRQSGFGMVDPVATGLAPAVLVNTGQTDTPVLEDRPPWIALNERLRQWGGGVTWYVRDQNLKLEIGWLQTEHRAFVRDAFSSYTPDVGYRKPGSSRAIREENHIARTGSRFRRSPQLYAVLSWYY